MSEGVKLWLWYDYTKGRHKGGMGFTIRLRLTHILFTDWVYWVKVEVLLKLLKFQIPYSIVKTKLAYLVILLSEFQKIKFHVKR
jgi:hypothetical protein